MQINEPTSNRIAHNRIVWIDWTKAILIFLVILGHSGSLFSPILYIFHIPGFFFVSGYLCNYEKKQTGSLRSSTGMVYAIFLYNFIFIILNAIIANITGRGIFHAHTGSGISETLIRPIIGIFWCYYKSTDFSNPLLAQFWFVWVLIILRWLYKFIYPINFKSKLLILFGCIAYSICIIQFKIPTLFYIDRTIICLPFFMAGNVMRSYPPPCNQRTKRQRITTIVLAFAIISTIYIVARLCGNLGVDIFNRNLGSSVIVFYSLGFLGTYALILGCSALPPIKIIEIISIGTFFILAIHLILLHYFSSIIPDPTRLIVSGCIILLCVPFIHFSSKWCPIALGKHRHS